MRGAEGLCASTLGRRLLFRQVSAHPERLEPADAAYVLRASIERPAFLDVLRAVTHDSARELDQVRCPVLLVWAEADRVIYFKRYGRPLQEALPSVELRTLHDVGHVPMLDDPKGVASVIRDFAAGALIGGTRSLLSADRAMLSAPPGTTTTGGEIARQAWLGLVAPAA
jgi:pimeloyl-ACP methyl ester carboxylesterase